MSTTPRRRGSALEQALLSAALEQLVDSGYADFTMHAVAGRAGTSRPVLYRRWSDKHELVVAAITHLMGRITVRAPDTGSLRGDMIAMLRELNENHALLTAAMGVHVGTYRHGGGDKWLGEVVMAGQHPALHEVLARAAARGDIVRRPPDRVASVPFDLLRHEFLMTLRPVPDDTIEGIVDTVFLPLVTSP